MRPAGHEQRGERAQSDRDSPCELHSLLPSWGRTYAAPNCSEPRSGDGPEYRVTPTWGTSWVKGLRRTMYVPALGCFRCEAMTVKIGTHE